jgi:hypothetical protein
MTQARNYREGLMRRAATFRVGHQAFEGLDLAPCRIHQPEI